MMFKAVVLVTLTLFAVASAGPRRGKIETWDSSSEFGGGGTFTSGGAFAGPGTYAGHTGAFAGVGAGAWPGTGAWTGTGAGAWPFYRPFPYFSPFTPFISPFGPPFFPSYVPFGNWYEGPNVCKSYERIYKVSKDGEEVEDKSGKYDPSEGENTMSHCSGEAGDMKCTKTIIYPDETEKRVVTKYICCHGFIPSGYGCSEIDMKDLLPTLRDMGAVKFVENAEKVGLADSLHSKNYTIFCPSNSALDAYEAQQDQQLIERENMWQEEKPSREIELRNTVTSHMTLGFLRADDFENDQVFQAVHQGANIRINVYFTPEKVITANCVPISSTHRYARNGIIHTAEKLLPFPTRTVADIVAADTQFSVLKRMLSRAGLVQTLRNPNATYTLFAPTDSAFRAASHPETKETTCTVSVMKHHILDHVICSSAITHQMARSPNLIDELLTFTRDVDNKLYVDDVQVVARDLIGLNGVVHVIDGLLSTRQAKSITEMLKDDGLTEFLSLLDSANLKSEFDAMENVTFFIPTNDAIKSISSGVLRELRRNTAALRNILLYHTVDSRVQIRRNETQRTLESKFERRIIRIQTNPASPHGLQQSFVQCATVLSPDNKLCGNTMHVINRMLFPPRPTIVDVLQGTDGFSTLVLLLRTTGLERRLANSLGQQESFTLLAPTDDAFHRMGDRVIFRLFDDVIGARDLLRMHILAGTVCCSQLKNKVLMGRQPIRALDGSLLALEASFEGSLLIGGARIVDCEIMANNGAVHMVDAVLRHDVTSEVRPQFRDSVFIRW